MSSYEFLKKIWKKLGINGQVINFSSKVLWVLDTTDGITTARKLTPGFRTPIDIDFDAFKRVDGKPIDEHSNWWKFYDVSTVEVFDYKKDDLKVSAITKIAVDEEHFHKPKYVEEFIGQPVKLVTDVKRNKKKKIVKYFVTEIGWLNCDQTLEMTCRHEIANARPVFPSNGLPYIRTRRDIILPNNLSRKGST
jgi:hypothetical protein